VNWVAEAMLPGAASMDVADWNRSGLHTVSVRAPDGFGRIEDVLSAAELAAFDEAYRTTTLPDVAALNSRPSLTP
jgi:hypothetical protein